MSGGFLTLRSEAARVVLDPGRGADVLSLVDAASGADVLFATPWRERADRIRAGECAPTAADPTAVWLEQYRGGWQTLCPNAGAPRQSDRGAPWGFHGEAASSPWIVDAADDRSVSLHVDLFTAPVRIVRELRLDGPRLTQHDSVINQSRTDVAIDYSAHPAFGPGLIAGGGVIETDARTFVADDEASQDGVAPGSAHEWPWLLPPTGGEPRDLRVVPAEPVRESLFGWLTDFERGRVSITSPAGLAVELEWDATVLPFAWVWQELESSDDFPWFGRARVLAIEPASTPTSGPHRTRTLAIPASGEVRVDIAVTLRAAPASAATPSPRTDTRGEELT